MELIKALIHDCLTGIDGKSYDIARVLLFFGGIGFVVFSGYHVYHNHTFDPTNYGIGLGGIIGGGGAGIKIKETTEPKSEE